MFNNLYEWNLYRLFSLSTNASQSEIKKAYHRLVHKYHPDLHHGDKKNEETFKLINAIYAILNDPKKRSSYDFEYRVYRRRLEMINWKFNPDNYDTDGYQLIPPGKYRVRIEDVEEMVSKTGKPMIKMTLKVSGYNSKVWNYMVFDNSTPEAEKRTDNNLGRIYDSFNIPQGSLNLQEWKGKVGGAEIKNEPDNKQIMRHAVSWFLRRKEQEFLPAWQEHPAAPIHSEMMNPNEPIPF